MIAVAIFAVVAGAWFVLISVETLRCRCEEEFELAVRRLQVEIQTHTAEFVRSVEKFAAASRRIGRALAAANRPAGDR